MSVEPSHDGIFKLSQKILSQMNQDQTELKTSVSTPNRQAVSDELVTSASSEWLEWLKKWHP